MQRISSMNNLLNDYISELASGKSLPAPQINKAASLLVDEVIPVESKFKFLKFLALKGETNEEFSAFVSAFRAMAQKPQLGDFPERAIDLCGTGGDGFGSFNISTFVSLVVAAGGVPVIKHGNRSISSKCGSADLLEALGIPLENESNQLQDSLEHLNFCFLFAPHYHPAFKNIGPTRKALAKEGIITVFNRLGPCLNPANPSFQILGVYDPKYLDQMAYTLEENGGKSGWIVHGKILEGEKQKMDELTACGPNIVKSYGLTPEHDSSTLYPDFWGQTTHSPKDLLGGTLHENLNILESLILGNGAKGLKSSIIINAASAFLIAGAVRSIDEGVSKAQELLDHGGLMNWLKKAKRFFS